MFSNQPYVVTQMVTEPLVVNKDYDVNYYRAHTIDNPDNQIDTMTSHRLSIQLLHYYYHLQLVQRPIIQHLWPLPDYLYDN